MGDLRGSKKFLSVSAGLTTLPLRWLTLRRPPRLLLPLLLAKARYKGNEATITAMVTSRLDQRATPEKVPASRDSTVRSISKIATTNPREKALLRMMFCEVCSCRLCIMKTGSAMTTSVSDSSIAEASSNNSPTRSVLTFKAHQYLYVALMSYKAFGEEHFSRKFSAVAKIARPQKHTKIIEIVGGSAKGECATDTNPECSKSERNSYPPHTNECPRYIEQQAVKDQKRCFDTPQHHENQERDHQSQLEVFVIERVCKRRSFLLMATYCSDSC